MTKDNNKNNIHVLPTTPEAPQTPEDTGIRTFRVTHVTSGDGDTVKETLVTGHMSLDPTTGMVGFAPTKNAKSISFMIPMHTLVSVEAVEDNDARTG